MRLYKISTSETIITEASRGDSLYYSIFLCVCIWTSNVCLKKTLVIWILTRVLELIFHTLQFNDLGIDFFIVVN